MIFKIIYLYIIGYIEILVEGFYIERFINICKNKKIILWDLKRDKNTIIKMKIGLSDFKKIRQIAKKTKSRLKIERKNGIPFLLHRYRKRKIFAITLLVIAILIYVLTRYIWNIEISGLESINQKELLDQLNESGIILGSKISKVDTQKIINEIMLKRDDIAWMGVDIKGTNIIVNIVEAKKKPDIIDYNKPCNIIATKDGIITKINVQNGTARVNVGDTIKANDLLVEGIMEGVYTGNRNVHSKADVYAKVWYTKDKTLSLKEEYYTYTGEEKNGYKIKINNFEINLNKRLLNFEKCDTMSSRKKVKLFSNLYIPVEIEKITYKEKVKKTREYTEEELTNKLKQELEDELISELEINKEKILEKNYTVYSDKQNVYVKIILVVEENIARSVEIVF